MPGGGGSSSIVQNNSYNDGAFDIMTMQDIDRMSRELILPSLNMTKSSSFIPNTFSSPLDNPAIKSKLGVNDSPYSHVFSSNIMTSP